MAETALRVLRVKTWREVLRSNWWIVWKKFTSGLRFRLLFVVRHTRVDIVYVSFSFSNIHTHSWQASRLAVFYFSSMPCSMSGAILVVWQWAYFLCEPFSHTRTNTHKHLTSVFTFFIPGSSFLFNTSLFGIFLTYIVFF